METPSNCSSTVAVLTSVGLRIANWTQVAVCTSTIVVFIYVKLFRRNESLTPLHRNLRVCGHSVCRRQVAFADAFQSDRISLPPAGGERNRRSTCPRSAARSQAVKSSSRLQWRRFSFMTAPDDDACQFQWNTAQCLVFRLSVRFANHKWGCKRTCRREKSFLFA